MGTLFAHRTLSAAAALGCCFGVLSVEGVLAPGASDTIVARLGGSGWGVCRIVGKKRSSGLPELIATTSKLEISVHAGSEECFHIVGDHSNFAVRKLDSANVMTAS